MRWLLVSAIPLLDKEWNVERVLTSFISITEQYRAKEELRTLQNQLLMILDNQAAGIAIVSQHSMKILYANKFLQQLYPHGITGKNCIDVFGYRNEACARCPVYLHAQSSDMSEATYFLFEFEEQNTAKWFLTQVRSIQWMFDTPAAINIFTDITPLKEAKEYTDH